jgi:hypothetical protein
MKTNSSSQREQHAEPVRFAGWRKILSLLWKCGELVTDVEKATGRKYDVREWIQ